MKKLLAVGIILLLVCVSIPSTGRIMDKSNPLSVEGNTLYVGGSGPNNYTKIQDAIDNASDGDTVFVYNGTYVENLVINTSISLIGEDRNTTIVNGGGSGDVIYVSADWVNISGFTIQYANIEYFAGIALDSYNNNITGNILTDNWYGMHISYSSKYNTITGNTISNNEYGVYLDSSSNTITGNIISNNWCGIYLDERSDNKIMSNNIKNSFYGIVIDGSSENIISENDILYNEHKGMYLHSKSSNNIIRENNILNNDYSLDISGWYCTGNKIYHNNIINNVRMKAFDNGNNTWDNGYPSGGNYWDYYNGKDKNGDGIGDEPYLIINPDIPGFQVGTDDRYPLMAPHNLTEPYLAIKINIIGFGVKISIKNVGNETAYNVNWNITTVGIKHRFTDIHKEGHSSLPLKTDAEKNFRLIPFGLWEPIDIIVIVNATDAVESRKIASGIILLCFVIVTDFYWE